MKVYEFASIRSDLSSPAARKDSDAEVNARIMEFAHSGYTVHSFASNVYQIGGFPTRQIDILFIKDGEYYNEHELPRDSAGQPMSSLIGHPMNN